MAAQPEIAIETVDPAQWDALLRDFPDRTVFHSLEWLQTLSAVHRLKIVLAAAHVNGRCVAVWPYLEKKKGPFRVIGSPLPGWSSAYMGPLFAAECDVPSTVEAFLDHKLFRRYAYFACRVIDRSRPVDLQVHGFSVVTKFETYLVDLMQTEDAIWENFKSECRTRIRKAEKLGLQVKQETDASFIDDYWAMSLETFAKANIQPTHNRQFVTELWNRFTPQDRLRVFSVFQEEKRIATLVLPFDDHTMYYWGGAAFLSHRDLPSHNLLHWHAMREGRRLGLRAYDFISTKGGPGRFKKTFGPQAVEMSTYWERSPSRLMAALKQRYQNYLLKRRHVAASPEQEKAEN